MQCNEKQNLVHIGRPNGWRQAQAQRHRKIRCYRISLLPSWIAKSSGGLCAASGTRGFPWHVLRRRHPECPLKARRHQGKYVQGALQEIIFNGVVIQRQRIRRGSPGQDITVKTLASIQMQPARRRRTSGKDPPKKLAVATGGCRITPLRNERDEGAAARGCRTRPAPELESRKSFPGGSWGIQSLPSQTAPVSRFGSG